MLNSVLQNAPFEQLKCNLLQFFIRGEGGGSFEFRGGQNLDSGLKMVEDSKKFWNQHHIMNTKTSDRSYLRNFWVNW